MKMKRSTEYCVCYFLFMNFIVIGLNQDLVGAFTMEIFHVCVFILACSFQTKL